MVRTKRDTMVEIETRKFDSRRRDKVPVFAYFRVSTKMQDYDRQVAIVEDYCNTELGKGYEVVAEYMDKVSGADANRPQYKEMWSMLKSGRAKVVICSSMDRFGRNLSELLKAVDLAKKHDIELRFIKDRLIINNEESFTQTLIMQLLGAVAEFESNIASERVKQKVAVKRENPFWWTGQKPRVTGEMWMDFVDMYYAQKPRMKGGKGPWKPKETYSATETSYLYSLKDIGDHFSLSKGSVSDMINKYVQADIMTHRSPKKAKKLPKVSFMKLKHHMKEKKAKKGSHSILHPHYWPANIRDAVSKKFGDFKKIEKMTDRDKTLAAWKYGKKLYFGWMKTYVREAIENAAIFAHHKNLTSGGSMSGLVKPEKTLNRATIRAQTPDSLAEIADKHLEASE